MDNRTSHVDQPVTLDTDIDFALSNGPPNSKHFTTALVADYNGLHGPYTLENLGYQRLKMVIQANQCLIRVILVWAYLGIARAASVVIRPFS